MLKRESIKRGMVFIVVNISLTTCFSIGDKVKVVSDTNRGGDSIFSPRTNRLCTKRIEDNCFQYVPLEDLRPIKQNIKKI